MLLKDFSELNPNLFQRFFWYVPDFSIGLILHVRQSR
jgi:hypothetical protein